MKSPITSLAVVCAALVGACASAPAPRAASAQLAVGMAGDATSAGACAELPSDARPSTLFARQGAVASVENLTGKDFIGARTWAEKPTGARIVLAATPGLNVPWLERVMSCRTAADGPLGVDGARVDVRAIGGGFAVDVTAPTREAAREIQARAANLVTASR